MIETMPGYTTDVYNSSLALLKTSSNEISHKSQEKTEIRSFQLLDNTSFLKPSCSQLVFGTKQYALCM